MVGKIKLIPGGHFFTGVLHNVEDSNGDGFVYISNSKKEAMCFRVLDIGELVDKDRIAPGDLVLVKNDDVNEIEYSGQIFYYIDEEFSIKVKFLE